MIQLLFSTYIGMLLSAKEAKFIPQYNVDRAEYEWMWITNDKSVKGTSVTLKCSHYTSSLSPHWSVSVEGFGFTCRGSIACLVEIPKARAYLLFKHLGPQLVKKIMRFVLLSSTFTTTYCTNIWKPHTKVLMNNHLTFGKATWLKHYCWSSFCL